MELAPQILLEATMLLVVSCFVAVPRSWGQLDKWDGRVGRLEEYMQDVRSEKRRCSGDLCSSGAWVEGEDMIGCEGEHLPKLISCWDLILVRAFRC